MQIPLVGGEVFSSEDGPQAPPVVMVNQAMANRYWPNQDPLGKKIKIGGADAKSPWFTVKGVVKDSAQSALDQGINPEIYFARTNGRTLSPYGPRSAYECGPEEHIGSDSSGDS